MYLEKLRLDGRIAVVTGGGGGIGLRCCHALAEAGATVIMAERDPRAIESGAAFLAEQGYTADSVECDVADPDAVNAAAATVIERHGRVDILVCNAGIARSGTPAEDVTDEHWRNVIDINLNGVFWCCRAFGAPMLKQKSGAIVNIGSMSGFIVNKPQQQAYYNASKAGVHQLTKSLAAEWADRNVRVNAVAPTYIATPLTTFGAEDKEMFKVWMDGTPMRRMGEPEEVASVVQFLASDAASVMTGSIVMADLGYTCW
ncbi:SDR family oxidoreductase [Fodinicurvata sp. EGI_FJ10296]|uniref:SDR family NAD(P)-dependent oxidoreductase n=1 Tax=Fodinicurvata sp. EGI_FJ10296 TaxID=3231908 RepID=UPI0034535253